MTNRGTSLIAYLDTDPIPARKREFKRVAEEESALLGAPIHPVSTGQHLIDLAQDAPAGLDHLALIMHGSTTGLLRPGSGHGLHVWRSSHPRLYSVQEFARHWAPQLADGALISLCSCLCGRSPHWYLRQVFGLAVPGTWSEISYRAGGARGFAGRLRDAFLYVDKPVRVRAHTAAGHVTYLPLLREFALPAGSDGQALFEIALPNETPDARNRRRWVRLVKGELARGWLMGKDEVVREIRQEWCL